MKNERPGALFSKKVQVDRIRRPDTAKALIFLSVIRDQT